MARAELDDWFERLIRPQITGAPVQTPTAVFIAGQSGVGKTTTQALMVRRLNRPDVVSLDGDENVLAHPHYPALARHDDRTAHLIVDDDASYLSARSREAVRAARLDVITSYPFGDPQWTADLIAPFRQAGYQTTMVFVAGSWPVSIFAIINRYQQMRDDLGYGRWVTPDDHQRGYDGVLATADAVEQHRLVDAVMVVDRDGVVLYENALGSDGQWTAPPRCRQAILAERERRWTPHEQEVFATAVTQLLRPDRRPARLADDLTALVRQAVDAAGPFLPETGRRQDAVAGDPRSAAEQARTAAGPPPGLPCRPPAHGPPDAATPPPRPGRRRGPGR